MRNFLYLAVLALGGVLFFFPSVLSPGGFSALVDRANAVVAGGGEAASHSLTSTATIGPFDGYDHPGTLQATLTFLPNGDGAPVVFDLNYPDDYNPYGFKVAQMWHATIRTDLANNPQVSPIIGNSCLKTIRGEALAPGIQYRTGYAENFVCRVLDEEGPDAPRNYDISQAKPAVIGLIWANRNHQPIDSPRARCIAEARIWATEIAQPQDSFMACVFVIDEEPANIAVFGFELTDEWIVEVGGDGESWARKPVKAREAPRLLQYQLMQDWLADPSAHAAASRRLHDHIAANLDHVVPHRLSRLESIGSVGDRTQLNFVAKSTAEMQELQHRRDNAMERQLYRHIRTVVCGTPERNALMVFQENAASLEYTLNAANGSPMTLVGYFPAMPCD